MSEPHLAVSVRMAGALRKAGEAAAKLRRLGAAVSERSEFCRSSRSAAVLAVKLFSVPLGLLVLFGLRKEYNLRPRSFGSFWPAKRTPALLWKHVQDPCSVAGRRVFDSSGCPVVAALLSSP